MSPLSAEIVARAESHPGIKAGIARLDDVLAAPSYQAVPQGEWSTSMARDGAVSEWPPGARSLLVLGLHHPEDDPRLDWWDEGGSPGDRRLVKICESLARWLEGERGIGAFPLPYHPERGGVFLKDAAVLAGLGVMGRNNLIVTPAWGPRVRFRAILLEADLEPTERLETFSPCESCREPCRLACPRGALSSGAYHRPSCMTQMDDDEASKVPDGDVGAEGTPRLAIKYCRACELACPVGA